MSPLCHIVSLVDRDDCGSMNAESLVITFKRDMAKLSGAERRRLRLRSRTLLSLRVRSDSEEGEDRERRSALPPPGLRQDLRHGQWAHPGDEQAPEGDLDGLRRLFRAHASPARMREALPRLPQDRLHHAPQADRVPLGLLPPRSGSSVAAAASSTRPTSPSRSRTTVRRGRSRCRARRIETIVMIAPQ